jgi:CBS domain-containing protein
MDEFKVSHMPVVDDGQFKGMISESDIMDANAPGSTIAEVDADLERAFVGANQHIYYVIRKLAATDLSCIAVLDDDEKYVGCITLSDMVVKFEDLAVINQPGGILVIRLKNMDYSLARIAHIVESNDVKILSSYIFNRKDTGVIDLTLKVNREDLSPVIQSLERNDYEVVASFYEATQSDDLKGRYDELMRYINF